MTVAIFSAVSQALGTVQADSRCGPMTVALRTSTSVASQTAGQPCAWVVGHAGKQLYHELGQGSHGVPPVLWGPREGELGDKSDMTQERSGDHLISALLS